MAESTDIQPQKVNGNGKFDEVTMELMAYLKDALQWITGLTAVRTTLFLDGMMKTLKTPANVKEFTMISFHSVEQDLNEARQRAKDKGWKTVQIDETTFESRMSCFLLAAQTGLPLGSYHQYFYLVPYGKTLTLDMSWRGYLAVIKRAVPSLLDVNVLIVYEGDEYEIEQRADGDRYSLKIKDPFRLKTKTETINGKVIETKKGRSFDEIIGCIAVMTFKDRPQKIFLRDQQWLLEVKNRVKAKDNSVWDTGFFERMVWKSVLKSVAQPYTVDSQLFKELDSYDNTTQCLPFDTTQDPEKLAESKANSILESIKKREESCAYTDIDSGCGQCSGTSKSCDPTDIRQPEIQAQTKKVDANDYPSDPRQSFRNKNGRADDAPGLEFGEPDAPASMINNPNE